MSEIKKRKRYIWRGAGVLFTVMLLSIYLCSCGKFNESKPISDKSRTIFVYMCGSDLESKNGSAGKNIDELLSADIGDDMNIVIETGGSAKWKSHDIKNDVLSRYMINNGKLELIETKENSNMGESRTLTDFLVWGKKKFPSENNILIIWDHGSGPVNGVCFDENYNFDPLTLKELKTALDDAGSDIKYDIIGFDACLMANLETAVTVSGHADYLIASEEIEPPGGWDYKTLAESYASGTDGLELGKVICDSYMEKSSAGGKDRYSTLSVCNLSLLPEMLEWFDRIVDIIDSSLHDKDHSSEMIYALNSCDRFGGNHSYQGKSNYIDVLDIFNHAPYVGDDLTGLWEIIGEFVPYYVSGDAHNGRGLSFFYPVLYDKTEIEEYINLGILENYNRFLEEYYFDMPDKTVEYSDTGSIDPDGDFSVSLTPDSRSYLCSIDYLLMTSDKSGEQHVLITDNDFISDSENTVYKCGFNGYLPALEGHGLFCTTTFRSEYEVEYAAPVMVNGERATYIFDYILPSEYDENEEGYFVPMGLWEGYDENGLADRELKILDKGDVVRVVTDITYQNGDVIENWGDEFVISRKDGEVDWTPFREEEYQIVYVVKDVFGNAFTSEMATFEQISDSTTDPDDGRPKYNITGVQPYTLGYIPEN